MEFIILACIVIGFVLLALYLKRPNTNIEQQLEQQLEGFIKERFFITSQKEDSLGETVVIVIERSKPYETINFDILEPMKRPRHIYYVDAFKETVSGKIKRQETLDLVKPE